MDDLCDTRDTLGLGVGERLHDRRVHSRPAGYRNCGGVDQNNSGTKTVVTVSIKERRAVPKRKRNEDRISWERPSSEQRSLRAFY